MPRKNYYRVEDYINSKNFHKRCSSFWTNYRLGWDWIRKHQLSLSKSKLMAKEYENRMLHYYIENVHSQIQAKQNVFKMNKQLEKEEDEEMASEEEKFEDSTDEESGDGEWETTEDEESSKEDRSHYQEDAEESDDLNEDQSLTFEVDKGMLEFLEISLKHKKDLIESKMKEKEEEEEQESLSALADETDFINEQLKNTSIREEARKLYGVACEKILSMEVATQLNYERNVKRHQPAYWPCIPLNL